MFKGVCAGNVRVLVKFHGVPQWWRRMPHSVSHGAMIKKKKSAKLIS